jgi:uroporphyrinogen-III decarboxylase
MFSPITTATHVRVMMDVLRDVMKEPGLLKEGLDVITESLIAEAEALEEAGADAIFLAITRATAEVMTKKQYEDIAIEFDKRLLRSIDIPVIVHACGKEPYMDLILSLPHISGINWWDRGSIFTLKDMKERYGRIVALFGGLDQTRTFVRGATREDVINEGRDAIATAGHDGGFVLFSGCDLPIQVPAELLGAIKACVDLYGNYPLEV